MTIVVPLVPATYPGILFFTDCLLTRTQYIEVSGLYILVWEYKEKL